MLYSDYNYYVQQDTNAEPPGGPPLYINIEAISSQQLSVSWQPPAKDLHHGRILGYNLGLRKSK